MKEFTSKEKILKKVRNALIEKMPGPYDNADADVSVYVKSSTEYPEVEFAEVFSRLGGNFFFAQSYNELVSQLQHLLLELQLQSVFCTDATLQKMVESAQIEIIRNHEEIVRCQASLTFCEVLVSRLGAIVMSSQIAGGRACFSLPPVHIVVATPFQIVPDIEEAFSFLNKKYSGNLPSMITFVAGPSRTADIEKTLVLGAHGPEGLYLLLSESE